MNESKDTLDFKDFMLRATQHLSVVAKRQPDFEPPDVGGMAIYALGVDDFITKIECPDDPWMMESAMFSLCTAMRIAIEFGFEAGARIIAQPHGEPNALLDDLVARAKHDLDNVANDIITSANEERAAAYALGREHLKAQSCAHSITEK